MNLGPENGNSKTEADIILKVEEAQIKQLYRRNRCQKALVSRCVLSKSFDVLVFFETTCMFIL